MKCIYGENLDCQKDKVECFGCAKVQRKKKPKTNFERITANVESLTSLIERNSPSCHYCTNRYREDGCEGCTREFCKQGIAEWLRATAE